MPKANQPEPRKRPSIFWWSMINVLALAFAIFSWTSCYFLFNFPERPWNYSVLKKLDRLPPLDFFEDPKDLPKASTLLPKGDAKTDGIYQKLDTQALKQLAPGKSPAEALAALNTRLKRNYLTHFKNPDNLHYIRGTWRIISVRRLTEQDFLSDGYVILAQALETPEDATLTTELVPYPVEMEVILPTTAEQEIPEDAALMADNVLSVDRLPHALALLHVSRSGTPDEPVTRVTTIPLLGTSFPLGNIRLPLEAPTFANPEARFPLVRGDDEGG
ncbi:MAG: hypothetical protein Q7Q71_02320 [Verrucomicrobiota bacterium JB023]|nr:hypothetical protein [Verrucomicrobiota bacterium JB023]